MQRASIVLTACLLSAASARAGGFTVSEMGSRYAGRANAVVAVDDSPASVFFNPANLTALSGLHLEAGVSLILPRFEYLSTAEGAQPVRSELGVVTPPSFSASYTLDLPIGDLAFGLGFYVPYGVYVRSHFNRYYYSGMPKNQSRPNQGPYWPIGAPTRANSALTSANARDPYWPIGVRR